MLGGGEGAARTMEDFTAALKEMSVEFGESTGTLAKGLYDILSASIPASKALDVLRVAATAAKAGLTDTGTAADVLTTLLNAYRLSADKAGDISDLLFTIVKRGKTTFAELASSVGMVATVASSAGVTLEEVGAALAVMTRNGVNTDGAITALQAIISTFLKPSEEAVKLSRELGFEMSVATIKAEGLRGVFRRIAALPPDAISKLFPNLRAIRGVLPALQNMAGFIEDLTMMEDRAGATGEAFGKMTDTIAHKFNQVRQAVTGLLNDIGARFAPVFDEALDILATWVDEARKWFDEYGEELKWYINDAWTAAKEIAANAWQWIKDNVLSLIGEDWFEAFENIKIAAQTFWASLQTIWQTGASILSKAIDIAKMFFEDPAHAGRMVADAFNEVWEIAAGAIDFTRGAGLLDKLADFFGGLVERLKETGFADKIMTLIAGVFAINNALWKAVLDWTLALGKAIASAVWAGISGPIETLLEDPMGAKGGIQKAIVESHAQSQRGSLTPAVPQLAEGGIVTQPTVALIGEEGPEAVMPLSGAGAGGAMFSQTVNVNVSNPVGRRVTENISDSMRRLKNRGRLQGGR